MGGQLQKFLYYKHQYSLENVSDDQLSQLAEDLISLGNLEGLKCLLKKDIKMTFKDGSTLLHLAALHQQSQCVAYILNCKVINVNSRDNSHETALNSSLVNPASFECSNKLIKAGININLKNKWLRTPLLKCVLDRNEPAVLYLLEKGANPNIEDCMGCTPLNRSVYYHLHKSVSKLLESSVDIDYANKHGQNALSFACKSLNKLGVQRLIDSGAIVSVSLLRSVFKMHYDPNRKHKFESIIRLLLSALCEAIPLNVFTRTSYIGTFNILDIIHHCMAVTNTIDLCPFLQTGGDIEYEKMTPEDWKRRYNAPPTLKHISRLCVRVNLVKHGGNVVSKLKHLNAPPGLKSVILLDNIKLI